MLFRELGDVADNTLKVDAQGWSSLVKKAIAWYIKKGRQLNCSLIGDMQRPEDVMPKIRDHCDWFHIKSTPIALLGEGFKVFIQWLTDRRDEEIIITDKNWDKINEKYPRVQDLTESYGWAVSKDEVYRLTKYTMPKHHHWRPEDHWDRITGIYWKWEETDNETVDKEGVTGQDIPLKQKIVDNTMEQVSVIVSMMNDTKHTNSKCTCRKCSIKKYSLTSKSGRWGWENFIYPIYSTWHDNKQILSQRIRPTPIALKNYYNEASRKQA